MQRMVSPIASVAPELLAHSERRDDQEPPARRHADLARNLQLMRDSPSSKAANTAAVPLRHAHSTMTRWCGKSESDSGSGGSNLRATVSQTFARIEVLVSVLLIRRAHADTILIRHRRRPPRFVVMSLSRFVPGARTYSRAPPRRPTSLVVPPRVHHRDVPVLIAAPAPLLLRHVARARPPRRLVQFQAHRARELCPTRAAASRGPCAASVPSPA